MDHKQNSNSEKKTQANQKNQRAPNWIVRVFSLALFIGTGVYVTIFGERIGEVSIQYNIYVTPPDFFFGIWAVIFAILGVSNIINLLLNVWTLNAHIYSAMNNLLMVLWVYAFETNTRIGALVSMSLFIVGMIIMTVKFDRAVRASPVSWFTYVTRNGYGIYLGWIVGSANVGFGILHVYWLGIEKNTQLIVFWILAPLSYFTIVYAKRKRERQSWIKNSIGFFIGGLWAIMGAWISSSKYLGYGEIGNIPDL